MLQSEQIDKSFACAIFFTNQSLKSYFFGFVQNTALAIIRGTRLIKVGRLMQEHLAEFVNKQELLWCEKCHKSTYLEAHALDVPL